jgi:hypothetical protein
VENTYQKCWRGDFHEQLGKVMVVEDLDGDGALDIVVSSENDPSNPLEWSRGINSGKVQIIWDAFFEY